MLLIVLAAYSLYALLAVPLLDPLAVPGKRPALAGIAIWKPRSFEHLFPAGSWELERPIMLETNQGTLLFDEHSQSDDGKRLRLERCTFIYDDAAALAGPGRQLILRAQQGATLYFDPPLRITELKFGRLSGGTLTGRVTIEGSASGPDKDDELYIETRDVEVGEQRIWTPHEVDFRYGPHRGRGKNLSIYLDSATARRPAAGDSPAGKLKSLELLRVEYFHLKLAQRLFSPSTDRPDHLPAPAGGLVQIRCQGPFRFDFQTSIGSLEDHVQIAHQESTGPQDQLQCDLLELHMQPASSDSAGSADKDGPTSSGSEPRLLVAVGSPVIIRAPSRDVDVQAQRIEYDVAGQSVRMSDRKRLTVSHGDYTISAPEVRYSFVEPEQLGEFWAAGPGELTGRIAAQARSVAIRWTEEVRLDAHEGEKVLHLKGAENIAVDALATVSADDLFLWLSDQPAAGDAGPRDEAKPQVQVDRLRAVGKVLLDSPRLLAELEEARIWFEAPVSVATDAPGTPPSGAAASPSPLAPAPAAAAAAGDITPSRYHLVARQLNALVRRGDEPVLDRLDILGDLRLDEMASSSSEGAFVRADQFSLSGGASPNPVAWLLGQPARGSFGGMEFAGRQIEIQQGRDRIHIHGPGRMKTTASARRGDNRDEQQREVPPVNIEWVGSMVFERASARFSDEVTVRGTRPTPDGGESQFAAHGQILDVFLNRAVSLREPNDGPPIDLQNLIFHGVVSIDHQLLDSHRARQSLDKMQVRDLQFNQSSGALSGVGPGWIVHRGEQLDQQKFSVGGSSREGLDFLRVDFAGSVEGNLQLLNEGQPSEVVFYEDVRCLFGAIPRWDSELSYSGRESLGTQDGLLHSDRLHLIDMPSAAGDRSLEFRAEGDATMTGQLFTGSGHRLSYALGKDQLILEGEGRTPARLSYQKQRYADPLEFVFGKGYYYPKTRTHKVSRIVSLEAPLNNVNLRRGLPFPGMSR